MILKSNQCICLKSVSRQIIKLTFQNVLSKTYWPVPTWRSLQNLELRRVRCCETCIPSSPAGTLESENEYNLEIFHKTFGNFDDRTSCGVIEVFGHFLGLNKMCNRRRFFKEVFQKNYLGILSHPPCVQKGEFRQWFWKFCEISKKEQDWVHTENWMPKRVIAAGLGRFLGIPI